MLRGSSVKIQNKEVSSSIAHLRPNPKFINFLRIQDWKESFQLRTSIPALLRLDYLWQFAAKKHTLSRRRKDMIPVPQVLKSVVMTILAVRVHLAWILVVVVGMMLASFIAGFSLLEIANPVLKMLAAMAIIAVAILEIASFVHLARRRRILRESLLSRY
jgi:hypothetical protein